MRDDGCFLLEQVELPYPPSVNHYWVSGRRNGRPVRYLSERALIFKQAVALLCGRKNPFSGRVGVRVEAWTPDRKTRDLDNLLKGINDSITGAGVILDDSQIDEIEMCRRGVHRGGKVVVWLWEVCGD